MRTIYIDVYFLINFTVDLLALHFASAFSKVPVKTFNMIISAVLGGVYSVATVLMPENLALFISVSTISLVLICFICTHKVSFGRQLKFTVAFFVFLILIGGIVYLAFTFADSHLTFEEAEEKLQNRTLLLLSIAVLLSMGIIRLLFIMFDGAPSEKNVNVKIELQGRKINFDAFVDSGNLVRDPIDSTAVMFIKRPLCEKLFPEGIPEFHEGKISEKYKGHIRLIPIRRSDKTEILYGLRPDKVSVLIGKKEERIKITIALDNEGGTFGGYEALMPISALEGL